MYSDDTLEGELGGDLYLELISCDFSNPEQIIDVLNAWFQQRFPDTIAEMDLRKMYYLSSPRKHKSRK